MIEAGQTFKRSHGDHLWIVISAPAIDGGVLVVACVSITTNAPWKDQTCVLNAGEHSFVRHETVVGYNRAELRNASQIAQAIASGQLIADDDVAPALLTRIQNGALKSARTPNLVKDFLRTQGIR